MMHKKRRWCVTPVPTAEDLAEKLTEHPWTLCTGFQLAVYLFLNDATSEDGAQEYAVLKALAGETFLQVESITFSWCTRERALELIHQVLAGAFDADGLGGSVTPVLEPPGNHRCGLCA